MPYTTAPDIPEQDLKHDASADELYRLGLIYSTGLGVGVDLIAAHKWFNLAAMRGKTEARAARESVAEQMTDADVRAAQRCARQWPNMQKIAC